MAPRSTEARIAWFLANDPAGVGMCAQHSWRSLGGDYGDPPAWGAANANEVYDLVVASGRFWTSEPPRGALVLWKYEVNGHAEISVGSGQVVTTDPPGNPGGTGYQPLDHALDWGAVLSRRIWTDEYNGVRFDVGGVANPLPPLPEDGSSTWGPDSPTYLTSDIWQALAGGSGGGGYTWLNFGRVYSTGGLSLEGESVLFEITLPDTPPDDFDLVITCDPYPGPVTSTPFLTIPGPHVGGSTVVFGPFTMPVEPNTWSVYATDARATAWQLAWEATPSINDLVAPNDVLIGYPVIAHVRAAAPGIPSFDFTGSTGTYDLGSLPGYSTRVTPLPDASIPGIPDGSEYQVELVDPDGDMVAIGYLPRGADPNGPFTFRISGRFIVILYGGLVLITYLIPSAIWDLLNLSAFWVGYVDSNGNQMPDGAGVRGTPPPEGYQYILDTSFEEIVYPTRVSRVKNLYSEAIWEDANGIQASRLPLDGVYRDAYWGLNNGHTARISYDLAVRVWEAGLSRFLRALPNEVDREPLAWGASMDEWSTSDYDWFGHGLTTIKS